MKRYIIIIMAMALMLGMAQCKKNVEQITPGGQNDPGDGVYVTLTAGLGGPKTEIEQEGWHGLVTWTTGDKLYVVADTDGYLGALTAAAGGSATATFSGKITLLETAQDLHFYYVGKTKTDTDFSNNKTEYVYSVASQTGTLDGIENTMHLMHGVLEDVAAHTTSLGSVTMTTMMAVAKFDISGYDTPAVCSGALRQRTLDLKTGDWKDAGTTGDITLNNTSYEYYMALIPSTVSQTLTFKNNDNSSPVAITKTIEAGRFYTNKGYSIIVNVATVNFGLPSPYQNLEWSKRNLGATNGDTPASWYGDYYAWGTTTTWYVDGTGHNVPPTWRPGYSDGYTWAHCPHTNGTFSNSATNPNKAVFTKYIPSSKTEYWYNYQAGTNVPDNKTVLDLEDDVAHAVMGGTWRMPTEAEWNALKNNTTQVWLANKGDQYTGVNPDFTAPCPGRLFIKGTSPAAEETCYLFLPAIGYRTGTGLSNAGSIGYFWASTLQANLPDNGRLMYFTSTYLSTVDGSRYNAFTVRPVRQ